MSCKTIIPKRVLLRKGKLPVVMVQLHSLELTHPNLTVGEMADALARTTEQDIKEAVKEKSIEVES